LIESAHILDIAVRDPEALTASLPVFRLLFGVEEVAVPPELERTGSTFAHHFAVPPFGGIGFFALRDVERRFVHPQRSADDYFPWILQQRLSKKGEGAYYLGFDTGSFAKLEQLHSKLRGEGVRFLVREIARPDPLGHKVSIDPDTLHGVSIYYGYYDPALASSWQPEEGPRPKTLADAALSPHRVSALDVAVHDVEAARDVFETHLMTEAKPVRHVLDPGDEYLDCLLFDIGPFAFRVVAPRDPTRRYPTDNFETGPLAAGLLQRQLEVTGEGIHLLALEVPDLDQRWESMRQGGVQFLGGELLGEGLSRCAIVDPVTTCGLVVAISQEPLGHEDEA